MIQKPTSSRPAAAPAAKDDSQLLQKQLIADYFTRLSRARETGHKVVATFVPGNLTELLLCFDTLPLLPEINALQWGMRQKSGEFVALAERSGHSEDVCSYVKCDVGMLRSGNVGPTGERLPEPDLLLLSYTGCFTFLKWFEILRTETPAPVAMLHTPYLGDGHITPEMVRYMVKQLETAVIPQLEQLTGRKFDIDRLRELLARSARAEDDLVAVLEAAKHRPSPIDAYFGGVYYIGPLFTAFRGTEQALDYYAMLRREVEARVAAGLGPITPEGPMGPEKFRLVVEGPPNWTSFREFWRMFSSEVPVVVASTYTQVGGLYVRGYRHDPTRPLESLAEYCLGCYTNRSLPSRVDLMASYVEEYQADGFLVNSIKSCKSFSAGQLLMLRQVEEKTGRPGGFFESDLVDPRYFSAANIKNRIESYLQMLGQKKEVVAS